MSRITKSIVGLKSGKKAAATEFNIIVDSEYFQVISRLMADNSERVFDFKCRKHASNSKKCVIEHMKMAK